ncbi:hypothetical protein Tco_0181486, partial [Tanacetum coccineum]
SDTIGRFCMHDLIQEMGHYIVRGWKDAEENDQIEAIEFGGKHARIALEGLQGNTILLLIIINEVCNLCSATERARLASEGTDNLKDYLR